MSNDRNIAWERGSLLAALLVIAPLLGACSGGSDDANHGSTGEPSAPEGAATLGACDLLTIKEAEAVLGGTVGEPKAGAPVSSDTVRLTDCMWNDNASGRSVTIILRRSQTAEHSGEMIAGIRAELAAGGPVEDVDGFAGGAFWGANQLHVIHDGGDYLTVSVVGFEGANSRSAARQAAESAISHL